MNQIKIFNIELEKEDFSEINKFILSNAKRPMLSSSFADFISPKLQDLDVKCWLKNHFNYISTKESKCWKTQNFF